MGARDLILERFPSLSPTMQQAARFVVDHPNDVVIASMRTLAERAGAQPATFVRLAQQLGYAGWPELKSAFADDLGLNSNRYGQRAKGLAERGHDAALVGEMFTAQHRNLDATQAQSALSMREAAKVLKRAKAVHVAGFRASFPVAYSLHYGLRLFRNSVALIDGQAGSLEFQLRAIDKSDAVVVISFAPYSRESLQVLEAARGAGARVIAFTDSSASPLALGADVAVLFSVDSPSFFPSVAAGVAATEALLEILVAESGANVAEAIERAEQQLFDSGAYLPPPAKRHPVKS
ncbi:MurR/RpiR family transcriptional regulator [Piscinibacter sp.]|uniref:MurR/RpiR family transcriptional regulator n=1 Tax=Piscinibacter sp. TaxID=1903157 RepID=UPI002F3FEAE5